MAGARIASRGMSRGLIRGLVVVTLLLAVLGAAEADTMETVPRSCMRAHGDRLQCGPADISSPECEERSCCFDIGSMLPAHVPRCYHHSVDEVSAKFESRLETADEWSIHAGVRQPTLMADVNGDGHTDMLCFLPTASGGQLLVRMFNVDSKAYGDTAMLTNDDIGSVVQVAANSSVDGQVLMGDVNGDGASDVVSVEPSGKYTVLLATPGQPQAEFNASWGSNNFHFCANGQVSLGDFNGDGKKDLLCKIETPTPERTVALSDGVSGFQAWRKDPNFDDFCSASGDRIYVSDFDMDLRDDLLCQTSSDLQIALTDGDGFIINEDFNFPNWCVGPSDRLYPGDYNGDGRRDVLCHFADGRLCIRLGSYIFKDEDMFEAESCLDQTFPQNQTNVVVDPSTPNSPDPLDDVNVINDTTGAVDTAQPQIVASTVEFRTVDWRNTDTSLFCDNRQLYVADTAADGRLHLVCHDELEGLLWVAHSDSIGRPVVADASIGHDPNVRFCGRTNYQRHPPTLLVGHFDDDGKADLFCHSNDGTTIVMKAASTGTTPYQSDTVVLNAWGWCGLPEDSLILVDTNSGHRTDLLCLHGLHSASLRLVDPNSGVSLQLPTPQTHPCPDREYTIIVGNINNDQRDDVLCYMRSNGEVTVKLNQGGNDMFGTEHARFTFCLGDLEATLRIGDYNGDHWGDLLCHDRNGDVTVLYNQQNATTPTFGDEYSVNLDFNKHPGSYFETIDVNGDGYRDLVSHDRLGNIAIVEGHVTSRNETVNTAADQTTPAADQTTPRVYVSGRTPPNQPTTTPALTLAPATQAPSQPAIGLLQPPPPPN